MERSKEDHLSGLESMSLPIIDMPSFPAKKTKHPNSYSNHNLPWSKRPKNVVLKKIFHHVSPKFLQIANEVCTLSSFFIQHPPKHAKNKLAQTSIRIRSYQVQQSKVPSFGSLPNSKNFMLPPSGLGPNWSGARWTRPRDIFWDVFNEFSIKDLIRCVQFLLTPDLFNFF